MTTNKQKILFASYECAPFYKFGGLGDVAGSLPKALQPLDIDIRVVMPYYSAIKKNYPGLKKIFSSNIFISGKRLTINIFESHLPGSTVPIYFLSNKYFEAKDIFDTNNRFRFVLFSFLVAKLGELIGWQPDLVHANDWHTGLVPTFLRKNNQKIKTVFTIHNLVYSGETSIKTLSHFDLVPQDFSLVKNGLVNIMREAIVQSDIITTVSPTYAREILTPEFGCGLEDILKKRKKDLYGIINGLDYSQFDPAVDKDIKARYSLANLKQKAINKKYLQQLSDLPLDPSVPVIGIISRLVSQKGFDLLEELFSSLMALNIQLIILGTGEARYEKFFKTQGKKYSTRFKPYLFFDLKLANQIYAGSDIFLMPSKYEPCGLCQLIAMKYGTLPIVHTTGGLKDTVVDYNPKNINKANGFSFKNYNSKSLLKAINRTIKLFPDKKDWQILQKNGMKAEFSWAHSAREYRKIYQNNKRIKA